MNKSKKIISIVAAATLAFSTVALAGCGAKDYAGEKLTAGYDATAAVTSNGGFAVEKGNYVYFINGSESNTADNTYGDVVKGSLMRISKTELAEAKYDAAQIVIPSLFVAGDKTAGIFIYGEYVYYATPTTDKNTQTGEVENSYIDFKRSKLDGSEAPSDYFFRLSSNSSKYRFVEVDGIVYCMYEESGSLKSYNVATGKTTVLVSGAKSSFYYDLNNVENANVYYTMAVTYDLDEENSTTAQYDQVYVVNAATTATTTSTDSTVGYTAKLGDKEIVSYSFKKSYVEDNGEVDDYTTFPYVNLGSLVLDGVGSASTGADSSDTRFNTAGSKEDSAEPLGYNYTIQSYQNDGLYFTRKAIVTTASETENTKLYYLADGKTSGNAVKGNALVDTIADDTTYASSSALFMVNEDGSQTYFYVDGSVLKKATVTEGVTTTTNLAYAVSSATLWKTEGEYLYYYSSAANGNNITRINYKGEADNYNPLLATDEYKPVTLPLVDWNSAWYKPEFINANGTTVVLYCNAQSYGAGSTAYNYVYATKLGATADILATQEKLDKVNEFIDSYTDNSQLQAVMDYYFKTGSQKAFDNVRDVEDLYTEYQKDEFDAFVKMFDVEDNAETDEVEGFKGTGILETECIAVVGRMTEEDVEAIEENWADSLLSETVEEEEEEGLPTWAIILIIVGGVLVLAGATAGVWYYVAKKKAAAKKAESVVNAYQRKKIDTTDDKTIDVYADEETAEETEEEAPVATEEAPAEAEEAVVEETVATEEAPAEVDAPVEE